MSTLIEHGDVLDVRDLAQLAEECEGIIEAGDFTEDEVEEAHATLRAFTGMLNDLGIYGASSVSDALYDVANSEVTLIAADYFVQYAEELAEDIGAIDRDASWPLNRIDWDAAANDLKADYSEADLDGYTYYIRSW